jgi:hypothetical protein
MYVLDLDGYDCLVEYLHGYLVVFVPFMHVVEFLICTLFSHKFASFSQTFVSRMDTGTHDQGVGNLPRPPDPTVAQQL